MNKELLKYVDHTLLKPTATWPQILELCRECLNYGMASVCIPPNYIERSRTKFGDNLNICTVIGFPLGYMSTETKVFEARDAISKGANEIDMVINISDIKNGYFDKVESEIKAIKKVCGDRILKVIVETCYLSQEEKIELCVCISNAGADYIKTSTGFGSSGATVDDIKLFKMHISPNVKIKAAGGIKTLEDFKSFVDLGCSRIGTSSALSILDVK